MFDLLKLQQSGDPFDAVTAHKVLDEAIQSGDLRLVLPAHSRLLHKLDAFLTMLQKAQGDPADILQNVVWQVGLYTGLQELKHLEFTQPLVEHSREFIQAYETRQTGNEDYPQFISSLLDLFRETANALADVIRLDPDIASIEQNLQSPTTLQRAHRGYLLKLQSLVK